MGHCHLVLVLTSFTIAPKQLVPNPFSSSGDFLVPRKLGVTENFDHCTHTSGMKVTAKSNLNAQALTQP